MGLIFFVQLLHLFSTPEVSSAWGLRGHDTVCQAAPFLVKKAELKEFLTRRAPLLGYLCNIPDTYWRGLSPESKAGDFTHYINPENVDATVEGLPVSTYAEVIKAYQGHESKNTQHKVISVPESLGSVWWRAEQFFNLSLKQAREVKLSPSPQEKAQKQDMSLPYNKAVLQLLTSMGLLGHFVGDISMPYHSTGDYDGYKVGHGGIHGYYEDEVVGHLPGTLVAQVIKKGEKLKLKKLMSESSVVAQMKWMSLKFSKEIAAIEKIDQVLKPSVLKIEKGMELKTPAARKGAALLAPQFEPLIVNQMAHSARLLAALWEKVYEEAGSPDLKSYGSYKYPHIPDFIAPDYIPTP